MSTSADQSTLAIHADDALNVVPDVAPPIHLATTFRYAEDPDQLIPASIAGEDVTGPPTEHVYSRISAPNYTRFEAILTSLIGAPAVSYSSGLAAVFALFTLLNPKQVAVSGGYHGSHGVMGLFDRLTGLRKLELDCPAEELGKGDVAYLETPLNPFGTAFNIRAYADKAHSRGALLAVDSTFGPPGLQDPFKWGADIVIHSGSKYLGGHSDILCGVLATRNKQWEQQLRHDRTYLGSVLGNLESWLGVRSLRTLELRVKKAASNATRLVAWLEGKMREGGNEVADTVSELSHASLQKEEWLSEQMPNGFGPVFSMTLKKEQFARRLPSKLQLFHHATSLGGVESLIEWRAMSDALTSPSLLRVSVGIEDFEDLKEDLSRAFKELLKGW